MAGSTATGRNRDGTHVQAPSHALENANGPGALVAYSTWAYAPLSKEIIWKNTAAINSHPMPLRGRAQVTTNPAAPTQNSWASHPGVAPTSTAGLGSRIPAKTHPIRKIAAVATAAARRS